jgi:hypothetical protein
MTEYKPHGQDARDAHAIAIGKIAMAWNEYHSILGELYSELFTHGRNWQLALAAWHAIPSDKTQRDMLRKVAELKFKASSRELTEINWLLEKTNDVVSVQRNIGLHTLLWSFTAEDGAHLILPIVSNDRTAKALADTKVLKEYAHYEKQIRKMIGFAVGIQFAVSPRRRGKKTWPERPPLSKRSP